MVLQQKCKKKKGKNYKKKNYKKILKNIEKFCKTFLLSKYGSLNVRQSASACFHLLFNIGSAI